MKYKTQEFLIDFLYVQNLPACIDASIAIEWRRGGTSERLAKMINHIRAIMDLFEKNDPTRYAVSLREWRENLRFLEGVRAERKWLQKP